MERRAAVKPLRYLLFLLALVAAGPLTAGDREVVLVVSTDSPVHELDTIEIRKIFLGLPVLRDNRPLHPVRNASDTLLTEVFLQHVVAMSESAYDRRILAQMLQQGRPRPPELPTTAAVLATLRADRLAVSYVWRREVAEDPHVRILRVLWSQ